MVLYLVRYKFSNQDGRERKLNILRITIKVSRPSHVSQLKTLIVELTDVLIS